MSDVENLFEQVEDQPVPGGCDRCNAYRTVEPQEPGVFKLTIHHDDWCPFWRARKAGSN